MRDRDLPTGGELSGRDAGESYRSIVSIAHDFAALVAIFERQLEVVAPSDSETRAHISKAKSAAERGAKLSQELIALTQSST